MGQGDDIRTNHPRKSTWTSGGTLCTLALLWQADPGPAAFAFKLGVAGDPEERHSSSAEEEYLSKLSLGKCPGGPLEMTLYKT